MHTISRSILIFVLFFQYAIFSSLNAQNVKFQKENNNRENFEYYIEKTRSNIKVDGKFNEPIWEEVQVATKFYRVLPIDTGYADAKTTVRATYDDEYLYFAVKNFETMPGENIVESLRRDFAFGSNDNFLIFMDTYNDQTNGFSFGASAGGAKWEGLQANGGDVSLTWDCKWRMEVMVYEDHWTIEMAIPFKNLQYQGGVDEWGINFSRLDLKENEKSAWAPVPRQFPTASLAFAGTLKWETPPPKPKTSVSLIPYVLGNASKDHQNNENTNWKGDAGMDANINLSSDLSLDLTVNPDFSQAEVDEQVTNLDRFELFFPERRRFFLENKDLFTDFGKENIRPFFSRRIGLTNPVQAGARLSGKINKDMRIGLMNMQTGTKGGYPAANFTVASMQHQVFSRSNVGAFLVNKQLTVPEEEQPGDARSYNRVVGVDYNLASKDNRWNGKFFYHQAFTPDGFDNDRAFSTTMNYSTQQLELDAIYDYVGNNYRAETGYIRRKGYHRISPRAEYKFYPESEKVANHGPDVMYEAIYDSAMNLTDQLMWANYEIALLNRGEITFNMQRQYVKLRTPFDPTNYTGDTLDAGTEYTWNKAEVFFQSDPRDLFNFNITAGYGGYYQGKRAYFNGNLIYRFQPYGSVSVNLSYNDLNFPAPYQDVGFWLVGPKFDVTFTNELFLTAFWQYNEQINNINTNIRLQWRYQPVSDLFIVYTDNYFPENFGVKNRALVMKLSYWFN